MSYRQGLTPIAGYKYSAGIAYIAIPSDLDRNVYIDDCYKNSHVSLMHEDGGFTNRVPIDPDVLNYIEFPEKISEFGTPVVYVTEPVRNQLIVVARLNKSQDLGDLRERQFKIRRKFNSSYVEIVGSPIDKSISITVDGDQDASHIYLNVFNENNDGTFEINIKGDIVVESTNDLLLTQHNNATIKVVDQDTENETNIVLDKKGTTIQSAKITINEGDEPFTLGNKLKSFLDDLIDQISQSTVATAIGQQPLLNAAQIAAFKTRTSEFLSTIMFIDK